MRWLPRNWNDSLSLVVILGLPLLWVFGGLDETTKAQTVTGWLAVVYFYFRKSPPETAGGAPA